MYVYVNLSMYECISGAGEPAGGRRGDGAYYQRCRSDGVRNGCGENMRKEEKEKEKKKNRILPTISDAGVMG